MKKFNKVILILQDLVQKDHTQNIKIGGKPLIYY